MALTLLPTAAMAEGETANIAKVGETEYATLAEAVAAAKEAAKTDKIHSATITLLKNAELAAEVKLDGNDSVDNENPLDINIDLNNCTLDMKGFSFTIENGAVLEIFDGQIDSTLESSTNAAFYVNAESSCLLDNVTMTTTGVAVYARGDCALASVNNSNITAGTYAVTTNAASSDNYNPAFFIVDSTLKGSSPVLVNVPCELTIKDSTINGSMHGVIVRGGTANITGSTITQTFTGDNYQEMADYFNTRNWGEGNRVNLGALIVGNKHATSYQYPSDVTVTDTIIKTAGAHADLFPAIYTYANNAAGKGVNLSIGGDKTDVSGKVIKGNEENNTISISGGTFSSDVSAYVPNGYIQNENGAVETLGETNAVAKVGDTYYKSLADAYAAASEDGNAEITLLKSTTISSGMEIRKPVTLNLGGNVLTSEDYGFDVYKNFTLKNGTLNTATWGVWVQNSGVKFTLEAETVINADCNTDRTNAAGVIVVQQASADIKGKVTAQHNFAVSGNGSAGWGGVTINVMPGAEISTTEDAPALYFPNSTYLTITGGSITGGTGAYVKSGSVTISGGTIIGTGAKAKYKYNGNGANSTGDALVVETCKYPGGAPSVSITGGKFKSVNASAIGSYAGNGETVPLKDFITGGLFSSNPSAYVPATHHVEDSGNGSYPFAVKEGAKSDATIIVTAATNATVSDAIKTEDKDKIEAVKAKANVEGMAAAIRDDKKAAIAKAAGVTGAELAGKNVIETEITVKVEAKTADLANGKLTFAATPVATVKVNGAAKGTKVPVTNDMLNGQAITVKLPLPAGFNPEQIKHISSDGSVEYFLKTAKRGAKLFTVDSDNCAVFTITKFSTFELSGTVTYVEPSSGGGSSSSSRRYDVSAPSVKHGDVTVSPKTASKGDTVTITVKPDSGYELDTLTVKDASGSKIKVKDKGDGKFTFTMPASKVTVSAEFAEIETLDFADVSTDAYYYEAVKWAAKKGITGGTGDGTFNPNGSCTRAHIVTFLWRAAGSPEPKSTVSFADVPAGSYYAKAVAWAVENGITLGTGDGTFSPNATCTRAQSVTFLYRALGTAPTTVNGFTDVTADAFYADAVAWAVESGVTNGTSASTFSPNNGCTRAQIVTFLYRTMK